MLRRKHRLTTPDTARMRKLYIVALLALCIGGAGPFSLDTYLGARRNR
jgi:hypothetical protein